ncbi:unnamed protein product [Brassicogethes aeneus]|uniref:Uncharacterized protein n=2 Tax=Brassicogethes aeneus TaxID=1431903 RepID=A0A9P0AWI5_BRAAE|nr:unnamed protein product [Brassicogethes aeneus]
MLVIGKIKGQMEKNIGITSAIEVTVQDLVVLLLNVV